MTKMIKNFNWGHGIALFYIVFVGAVISALIASFGVDHTLVVDDYYAKDLAYQNTYDKMANNIASDNVDITIEDQQVVLLFNQQDKISGSVQFYRASDKSKDFIQAIESHRVIIPLSNIASGKWRLKIDWTQGDKAYYKEEIIYL